MTDVCTTNEAYGSASLASTCYCSCEDENNETISIEQLKEKIKQLREELIIDKKDLSSWKRKLTSASDERASSKNIGIFGAGILITVAITFVILDIPTLIVQTKRIFRMLVKCKYEDHQSKKEQGRS